MYPQCLSHSFFHLPLSLLLSQSHTLSLSFITPLTCTLSYSFSLALVLSLIRSSVSLPHSVSNSLSYCLSHSFLLPSHSFAPLFQHLCIHSLTSSPSLLSLIRSLSFSPSSDLSLSVSHSFPFSLVVSLSLTCLCHLSLVISLIHYPIWHDGARLEDASPRWKSNGGRASPH